MMAAHERRISDPRRPLGSHRTAAATRATDAEARPSAYRWPCCPAVEQAANAPTSPAPHAGNALVNRSRRVVSVLAPVALLRVVSPRSAAPARHRSYPACCQ